MNSDQVREKLLRLRKPSEDFTVILSGRKSRKVHGLYKPESREIVLHNKNFKNDDELMYTANPLQHPSVMINRALLPQTFSWYNPHLTPADDLDLYFRLGKFGLFANLKSVILMYR